MRFQINYIGNNQGSETNITTLKNNVEQQYTHT